MYTLTMRTETQQIDASDLRRNLFTALDQVVSDGRTIEIRRHGRVIAVLAPPARTVRTKKPRVNRQRLARLCKRHGIRRLALFGSVLRDDFGPDSDVDVLIDPEPGRLATLKEYSAAIDDLTNLFGRQVDLVKRSVVEKSHNAARKKAILDSAQAIYGEAD
jgi:uncharacterized protein